MGWFNFYIQGSYGCWVILLFIPHFLFLLLHLLFSLPFYLIFFLILLLFYLLLSLFFSLFSVFYLFSFQAFMVLSLTGDIGESLEIWKRNRKKYFNIYLFYFKNYLSDKNPNCVLFSKSIVCYKFCRYGRKGG